MKSKDQLLLEEAYKQILNEKQLRLLEEGKIADFLKKLGKGAGNALYKAKNALTTNPRLMKQFTLAGGILLALAAGNTAQAAEYGADAVNDLISQITNASADGTLSSEDLQQIMSGWEASHQNLKDVASQSADVLGNQAVDQSADKVSNIKQAFSNAKDIDSLYQGINSMAGADKITDIVNKYDVELRNLSRPSSLEEIAREISSEAQYRNFSVDQVKKILSTIDTSVLSDELDLKGLINKIK